MDLYENFTFMCGGNCSSQLYDGMNATITDQGGTSIQFTADGPDADYADFRDSSRFWVKRVFVPIIMCIGVIGNGLTIIILTRRRMRSSTNHYLTALAFSDTFYLIFAFTLSLNDYPAMTTYTYYSYYRYGLMLTDACSNTSVYLTVTFTIERYVAVCHPIRGKVLCTRSRAKRVIMGVVFFCFFVVIPTPLEWRVVEDIATTAVHLEPSELGANETYKSFYYWFTSITFIFVPFTLLAIFNFFLIRSVQKSRKSRKKMTSIRVKRHDSTKMHQEHRITIMLISVVILFLICQIPTALTLIYTSIYTLHPNTNELAVVLGIGNICNLLVAINAACNFVLYCAFSDRYRRTFLRIFLPCLFRLASPNQSQTTLNTAYTQVDTDGSSLIKRGRNSLVANNRSKGNGTKSAGVNIGLTQQSNVVSVRSIATNGRQRNGSINIDHQQRSSKHCRLDVPITYNGMCTRELRKDSDATNDTNLSMEELSVKSNITTTANSNGRLLPTDGRPPSLDSD